MQQSSSTPVIAQWSLHLKKKCMTVYMNIMGNVYNNIFKVIKFQRISVTLKTFTNTSNVSNTNLLRDKTGKSSFT